MSDELDNMITDCAKTIAYLEDPLWWPKRITRFLEVFEEHASERQRSWIRPAGLTPLVDLALERTCHNLVARLIYHRWS
jgi:hypothetical protein